MRISHLSAPAVAVVLVVGAAGPAVAAAGRTSQISVSATGGEPDSYSMRPAISRTGRYVVFTSNASNLVPGDTNGTVDVFVRDTRRGTTERVSLTSTGGQVDRPSHDGTISADGRYVAFVSHGTNLTPGDTNTAGNVFVRDRWAGTTTRVGPSSTGASIDHNAAAPAISADGRYVAYTSWSPLVAGDDNSNADVFVWERRTGHLDRVSVAGSGAGADDESYDASISADGRYVTFSSRAGNLVPGDRTEWDVYVRDRRAGTTTRISESTGGVAGDAESSSGRISGDGRFVVFTSLASNLVPGGTAGVPGVFLRDRRAGTTVRVTGRVGGGEPVISADGTRIAFVALGRDQINHVFVRDRRAGTTIRASVSGSGRAGDDHSGQPAIDGDGSRIAFVSSATNLTALNTAGREAVFLRATGRS